MIKYEERLKDIYIWYPTPPIPQDRENYPHPPLYPRIPTPPYPRKCRLAPHPGRWGAAAGSSHIFWGIGEGGDPGKYRTHN